jgi:hypothetical protein
VKIPDEFVISVCIPHKVGSHAWGQFSNQDDVKVDQSELDLPWKIKAELSLKVVVVRHPLERLLSVYRMIFENWCDEKRFLAQQWNNVCVTDVEGDGKGFIQGCISYPALKNTKGMSEGLKIWWCGGGGCE